MRSRTIVAVGLVCFGLLLISFVALPSGQPVSDETENKTCPTKYSVNVSEISPPIRSGPDVVQYDTLSLAEQEVFQRALYAGMLENISEPQFTGHSRVYYENQGYDVRVSEHQINCSASTDRRPNTPEDKSSARWGWVVGLISLGSGLLIIIRSLWNYL